MPWDEGTWDTAFWDTPPTAITQPLSVKNKRTKNMPKSDYINPNDDGFAAQLLVFKNAIGSYSTLLGVSSAQVTARYWVTTGESVPKDQAVQLVSTLAWRGLSRFPRAGG